MRVSTFTNFGGSVSPLLKFLWEWGYEDCENESRKYINVGNSNFIERACDVKPAGVGFKS